MVRDSSLNGHRNTKATVRLACSPVVMVPDAHVLLQMVLLGQSDPARKSHSSALAREGIKRWQRAFVTS